MQLIEAKGIGHSFEYELFSDVELELSSKKSIAIVGKSGSGKSTLLHILSTFLQPQKGSVRLFGEDISSLKEPEIDKLRRYNLGIVFQFHHLFKGMSAKENINIASILASKDINSTIIKKLQIDTLMDQRTAELSGGQQQRVSIARVLTKKPKIIFADEPTGNLDKETAELVMDVIIEYVKRSDAGLVLVTHDMDVASRCDAIYTLTDKKLQKV